jgi:hypothetical protein
LKAKTPTTKILAKRTIPRRNTILSPTTTQKPAKTSSKKIQNEDGHLY